MTVWCERVLSTAHRLAAPVQHRCLANVSRVQALRVVQASEFGVGVLTWKRQRDEFQPRNESIWNSTADGAQVVLSDVQESDLGRGEYDRH